MQLNGVGGNPSNRKSHYNRRLCEGTICEWLLTGCIVKLAVYSIRDDKEGIDCLAPHYLSIFCGQSVQRGRCVPSHSRCTCSVQLYKHDAPRHF